MMTNHFEDLWCDCESFQQNANPQATVPSIMEELMMKVGLYQAMDTKSQIPTTDQQSLKERMMGEILLTLTHLSVIDNINVYQALAEALQFRSIDHFDQKHSIK